MRLVPLWHHSSFLPRANSVVGPSAEYLKRTLFMNRFDDFLLSTTQTSQNLGREFPVQRYAEPADVYRLRGRLRQTMILSVEPHLGLDKSRCDGSRLTNLAPPWFVLLH